MEERIFDGLKKLETIRKNEKVFLATAGFHTLETYEQAVICIVREYEGEKIDRPLQLQRVWKNGLDQ